MTTAEKIAIRWLAAGSAFIGAVSAIILAADEDAISKGVRVGVMAISAGLAAMVAVLTTDTGQSALGTSKKRGK